ncbi:MAG TPA: hypothetical protein VGW39_16115 [Chthoniobacterales bacterium]|nr:hypothetical protein [Chthoniobacterales bacterium]
MSRFTRSIPDRSFAAFLSLLLMVPTGWACFTYFTLDHSNDNPDWVLRLLLHIIMEAVATAFLLSVLGLVWAVFTPAWLSRTFSFCREHFVLALAVFLLVIIGMFAYSFRA